VLCIIFKLNIQLQDYLEVCLKSTEKGGKCGGFPVLGRPFLAGPHAILCPQNVA